MSLLAEIQGHIASMDELLDIVGAMRSLAGMRVQEAQHALPGIRRYAESMAGAIGTALLLMPQATLGERPGRGRRALILCAAEHGFVGGFNERMIAAAQGVIKATDALFVLGTRGKALALERGQEVAWTKPMATRLAGAPDTINQLTAELYTRIVSGDISRVEVMFSRYRQGSAPTIEQSLLLPLETTSFAATPSQQSPFHNLKAQGLLEKLMAEYVFALLMEAAIESIASENAARFAAMESAHDNVSKRLSQLCQSASQARQSEITAELLDLVIGAEALTDEETRNARTKRATRHFASG